MTIDKIVSRFVSEAGKPSPELPRGTRGNLLVHPHDDRELVSYGTHFTLARIMLDGHGRRSWWLLNGDTYSMTTSRHQAMVRGECRRSGLPVMIVPFSSLDAARIVRDTIEPVEVTADRTERITHHADTLDQVPARHRSWAAHTTDGGYVWETARHRLGEALLRAECTDSYGERGELRTRSAYFLSAFDAHESRPHYFLCELPAGAAPSTVAEAFQALKPRAVLTAEATGLTVTRQGDVFAVPVELGTRAVHRLGKSQRRTPLLDLSHEATEVVTADDGTTYARGCLYHAPTGWDRQPEHRRQRVGDGRQWHQVIKNTVPVDHHGDSRAWSAAGNVD